MAIDIYTNSFFINDPKIYCSHSEYVEKYLNGPPSRSKFGRIISGYLIKYIRSIFSWIIKMNNFRSRLFTVINFESRMYKMLNNSTFCFYFLDMKSEIFSCVRMLLEYNSSLVSLKDSGTSFFVQYVNSLKF